MPSNRSVRRPLWPAPSASRTGAARRCRHPAPTGARTGGERSPPTNAVSRAAVLLSLVICFLATSASIATLLWDGAFPDPLPPPYLNRVLAEARGWSGATLLVATPLCLLSLRAALGGSTRGRLVWTGSLAYFVYTYLEFAVSPPFTPLYLVYVAAFACAVTALVISAASVDMQAVDRACGGPVSRRVTALFCLVVATLLAAAWLRDIVGRSVAGKLGWPSGADAVTHVVQALDLGLQVPLGIAAGVMLLRRHPAGALVAAIMLVNSVCMGAALTAMVAWSAVASGDHAWNAWPFAMAFALALAVAVAFLRRGHDVARGRRLGRGSSAARRPPRRSSPDQKARPVARASDRGARRLGSTRKRRGAV